MRQPDGPGEASFDKFYIHLITHNLSFIKFILNDPSRRGKTYALGIPSNS